MDLPLPCPLACRRIPRTFVKDSPKDRAVKQPRNPMDPRPGVRLPGRDISVPFVHFVRSFLVGGMGKEKRR
jgi:hypothetical protein